MLKKETFAGTLISLVHLKESPTKIHHLLVGIYNEHAPSNTTYKEWFQ